VIRDRRRGREVAFPALLADMEMRVGVIQSDERQKKRKGSSLSGIVSWHGDEGWSHTEWWETEERGKEVAFPALLADREMRVSYDSIEMWSSFHSVFY
jgi:hypothetical protein